MNIANYYGQWWNTGLFVSELTAGFFVVFLLLIPMYFVPMLKLKSLAAEHFITLSFQAMGVTFGILIGKTIGDFMLVGGDVTKFPQNASIGIGNSSGDITLAFQFMEFAGLPYIMAANVLGGFIGGLVAFAIFSLYNKIAEDKKEDLRWIFSNPTKKKGLLFANELIFVPIWLIGIGGILGLGNVDFGLKNTLISILAIVLLGITSPIGFFVLAFNFNLTKWLIGVIFLKNFKKAEAMQLAVSLGLNFLISAAIGTMFHYIISYY